MDFASFTVRLAMLAELGVAKRVAERYQMIGVALLAARLGPVSHEKIKVGSCQSRKN